MTCVIEILGAAGVGFGVGVYMALGMCGRRAARCAMKAAGGNIAVAVRTLRDVGLGMPDVYGKDGTCLTDPLKPQRASNGAILER